MTESALILEKQLQAAREEIEVLRQLTNHTVAIIVASGGRVSVDQSIYNNLPFYEWRHEHEVDTGKHVFSARKREAA